MSDFFDNVSNFASNPLSLAESAIDLASSLNPVSMGIQSFSVAANFIEKFGQDQVMQDRSDDCFRDKPKKGEEGCGAGAQGSRGFFMDLALALGKTIQETADELIAKSKELQASADSENKENFFILSAETQALGAMMKNGSELLAAVMGNASQAQSALVKRA